MCGVLFAGGLATNSVAGTSAPILYALGYRVSSPIPDTRSRDGVDIRRRERRANPRVARLRSGCASARWWMYEIKHLSFLCGGLQPSHARGQAGLAGRGLAERSCVRHVAPMPGPCARAHARSGHDDALAIILAGHHPGLRLLGVSTVSARAEGRATWGGGGGGGERQTPDH